MLFVNIELTLPIGFNRNFHVDLCVDLSLIKPHFNFDYFRDPDLDGFDIQVGLGIISFIFGMDIYRKNYEEPVRDDTICGCDECDCEEKPDEKS